jgi:hypothetical protein
MLKNATKCNKTLRKWCKNKHGASKIIDTFETYQCSRRMVNGVIQTIVTWLSVPKPLSFTGEDLSKYHIETP